MFILAYRWTQFTGISHLNSNWLYANLDLIYIRKTVFFS